MGFIEDLLKSSFPLIVGAVENIADVAVDGADLSTDQLRALYAGYVVLSVKGVSLANSTDNEYDDVGIGSLIGFCADTLDEAGLELPDVPARLIEN